MSDEKITQLTADTAPTTDDLAVIVNDPAGTPGTKKVTLSNLFTVIWAAVTNAATAKTTPVANDLFSIVDSAASNVIKKITFANVKAEVLATVLSGTYTPTLTNGTNIAASGAYVCQYMRVGNVVTVSGKIDIDTTAAAFSELGMSLPIASALAFTHQVGGVAKLRGTAADCGSIEADTTNDRASLNFNSTDTASRGWYFTFTYLIV